MNSFVYDVPTKVYFGENQLSNLSKELAKFGKRVLLSYGSGSIKKSGLYDKVIKILNENKFKVFELKNIKPNPRIDSVREGVKTCKENNVDVILAVGGGSVIDCSKFVAAGTFYDKDPWDISLGKVEVKKCLPIVDILTLSATGSEMDSGGVITNPETNDKLGFGSYLMTPKVSFLDPSLTYTVSKYQTACGSADIMSHIMEVYFNSIKDLYMLDTVMEGLMKTVVKYAPIALKEPDNYEARANLMWTASWAINGFLDGGKRAQSWSCHPMEHELSAYYDITHGLGLAILTPRWLKYCLDEKNIDRYVKFAVNVFNVDDKLPKFEIATKGIEKLSEFFFKTLNLSSTLTEIKIDDKYFKIMAKKAAKPLFKAFKPLNENDVEKIYRLCL